MAVINPQEVAPLQSLRDLSGGTVTEVIDALLPDNTFRLIQNMDSDVIGALRVRKGTTAIGDQLVDGKSVKGLYNFRDSGTGANSQQIAGIDNSGGTQAVLKYNNAGTWTDISGGTSYTAGAKFRFATFLDLAFIVNSAFDAVKSWSGSGALGTSQLTSVPVGQFINVFKSRLYIAGTSANPDRVYFSSIPDISGNITWTTATDWLDVNPSDGMNITGLANTGTLLLIFKERALYRWNGRATDADLVVDIGTTSQESVASRNGATYFFNPYGIWITDGGYPIRISKPIQRWIDAISSSYHASVAGVCDDDHYYCSVGDVTVDGVAYANVVLTYTISTKTWSVRTYPEQITSFANYIGSSGQYGVMAGNDDGDVLDYNVGSTDAGSPISYRTKSKKLDFGAFAFVKEFSDVFMYADKLPGAQLFITVEDGAPRAQKSGLLAWFWRFLGQKYRGRYFVFEVVGTSIDGQGELWGLEITNLSVSGYR